MSSNYETRKIGEMRLIKFDDVSQIEPRILESYKEVVPGWYTNASYSYGDIWRTVLEGEVYDSAIPLGVDFERGSVWHYPIVDGKRSLFGELLPWRKIWRRFIHRIVSEIYDLKVGDAVKNNGTPAIVVDVLFNPAELYVQTVGHRTFWQLEGTTLVYRPGEEEDDD